MFHIASGRFGVSFKFVPQLIDPKPFQFAHAVPACAAANLFGHHSITENTCDVRRGFSGRNTGKPNKVNLIRKDGELDNLTSPTIKAEVFRHGICCESGMPGCRKGREPV